MKTVKPTTILTLFALALPGILMADRYTREESREFDAGSIQKVVIEGNAGNISVSGCDEPSVTIDIELFVKASDEAAANEIFEMTELTFDETDGVLKVEVKTKGKKKSFLGIFKSSKAAQANITVKVPSDMDLQAKTGSGNVSLNDVTGILGFTTGSGNVSGSNVTGEVNAKTGSGNLNLDNVQGQIKAHTGSGSIRIDGMEGSLDAATGSGDLNVNGQISQFITKTGSGSIRVESSVELTSDSKAATGNGGIVIVLPESAGFVLSAAAGIGGVDCDFELVDLVDKKRSLKGATAKEGPKLSIATGAGSINVYKN